MNDLFHTGMPWESPELTSKNRLPMRSPLFPFPTAQAAFADASGGPHRRAGNPGGLPATPWALSLDGRWRFALAPDPQTLPEGWVRGDYDDSSWDTITVPGSWSLQGHDKPHYTNVVMPFGNVPPSAPAANPTGLLPRSFRPAGRVGGTARRTPRGQRRELPGRVRERSGGRLLQGRAASGRIRPHAVPSSGGKSAGAHGDPLFRLKLRGGPGTSGGSADSIGASPSILPRLPI